MKIHPVGDKPSHVDGSTDTKMDSRHKDRKANNCFSQFCKHTRK